MRENTMLALNELFTFRDQSVAWGRIGAGGDPIILIHGFPWSAQSWRNVAPWLARRHSVYYFDMVGCGESEKRENQAVSEAVQNDLLQALIKHWGIKYPQVVGHDFGGLAALRGHFINGIEYSKLHLINSVAVLPSGSPFYAHVAKHESAFSGLPAYSHEALFRAYIQAAAHYPLRDEAINIYLKPWIGEAGRAAFYRQIAQSDLYNIEQAQQTYRPTEFDVHITWGMRDTFIPPAQGQKLFDLFGAKSFTPIADASHLVHEDAPAALLGSLLQNI